MRRLTVVAALFAVALALGGPAAGGASARTLIDADRSGGFAGVDDHLVVRVGGTGTYTGRDGRHRRLRPAATREVRRVLRESDFASLRGSYRPRGVVADAFEYRISYRGRTVVYVDGAENVPDRLSRILNAVSDLMSGRGG
jgi:hypothetical protein